MKKNLAKLLCFLLLFVMLFALFYQVLQYRFEDEDGIEGMKQFYKVEAGSVDVLCLGSSHMFVDVNTAVLWEDYGIAAFDLGGTIQPMWNTYYYMKEALKTQTPKLIVVDCFGATLTEEYADESGIIKNTFGMKLSMDKYEAIKVSAPDKHLEYLLGYPGYHSRYTELGHEDFASQKGIAHYDSWVGNHFLKETADNVAVLKMDNIKDITETEAIHEKEELYLQKIIDLAKEKNIPLMLMATPYFPTEREEKVFNQVAELAKANDVPFINYNLYYDEMGLDFDSDFADGHHLNYKGSPKFTRLLANDIKNQFEIPDRRADGSFVAKEKYETMTRVYNQKVYNEQLKQAWNLESYLSLLNNDNYVVAIGLSGGFAYTENYGIVANALEQFGIHPNPDQYQQVYVIENGKVRFATDGENQSVFHSDLGTYDVVSVRCPNEEDFAKGYTSMVVDFNHEEKSPIYEGVTIFVYDKETETVADLAGFYLEQGKICETPVRMD